MAVRRESVYSTDVLEELPEKVGEEGSVRIVSSTNELFSEAARAAVSTWLYRPGRIESRAVRSRVLVPLNFVR